MKKIFITLVIGIFLVSIVSSYSCIEQTDNKEVQEFKMKLNNLEIEQDINWGMSEEAIKTKIKYFHPCKWQ